MAREVVIGPRAAVAKPRAGRNGYGPMAASKYPSPEARQNLTAVASRPRVPRANAVLVLPRWPYRQAYALGQTPRIKARGRPS